LKKGRNLAPDKPMIIVTINNLKSYMSQSVRKKNKKNKTIIKSERKVAKLRGIKRGGY